MNRDYANYLLQKTKEDYNLIAEDFSSTRSFIWPELNVLTNYVKDYEKVLDLGCGNGRLFEIFKNKEIEYFGIDNSEKLIGIAKKNIPFINFQIADALKLPFPDNYFDKVFSVAVLHHIPSKEFRLQFFKEIKRVLKPKGELILTVWGLWRNKRFLKLIFRFNLLKIFKKTKLDINDIFVPWQNKTDRYIHCFTKTELKKLTKESGLKVEEVKILTRQGTLNSNILLVARK